MPLVMLNRWPEGKSHALTFSYDDGEREDLQVIEILNRYNLKGTFNLNSARLERDGCVQAGELSDVYTGHEIATHTVNHPHPTLLPNGALLAEFAEDRARLEEESGRIIRGMSYPFGDYDERVMTAARNAGLVYGRTVRSHMGYKLPEDWMAWHPTCHDKQADIDKANEFLAPPNHGHVKLMYVWGHSYEFPRQNRWESFEAFCAFMGEHAETVWFATNLEIYDYVRASRRLLFSADSTRVTNPSSQSVWIGVDGRALEVPGGAVDMATT